MVAIIEGRVNLIVCRIGDGDGDREGNVNGFVGAGLGLFLLCRPVVVMALGRAASVVGSRSKAPRYGAVAGRGPLIEKF